MTPTYGTCLQTLLTLTLLVLSSTTRAQDALDSDADGIADELEVGDSDGDGIPDYLDEDDDDDGLSTGEEAAFGPQGFSDCDGDGKPDYLDDDDDDDGVPTRVELARGHDDGDDLPSHCDADDDNDGVPTMEEREAPDDAEALDTDGDGLPDYVDADDDGDTVLTVEEDDPNDRDTDGDGLPDRLDADDDDDGFESRDEDRDGDGFLTALDDTDRDGVMDARDDDDDGDGVPTRDELGPGGPASPRDTDDDGVLDYLDDDDDDDGVSTLDERYHVPDADANRNGIVAYLDALEVGPNEPPNASFEDLDGDGIADADDDDDDGDGVLDLDEPDDTDGDGLVDLRDGDDDDDGVLTRHEYAGRDQPIDSDDDGVPNHRDDDDDGDGLLTRDEGADPDGDGNPKDALLAASGLPLYLVHADAQGSDGTGLPDTPDGGVDGGPELPVADAGRPDESDGGVGGCPGCDAGGDEADAAPGERDGEPGIEPTRGASAPAGGGGCSLAGPEAGASWLWLLGLGMALRWRARSLAIGLLLAACGTEAPLASSELLPSSDGGTPIGPEDAGSDEPAPEGDAGGPVPECRGDVLSFERARGTRRSFSAALSSVEVHLAHLIPTCGGSPENNHAQGLVHATFETTGEVGREAPLVNADAADCYSTDDPAMVAPDGRSPGLFYLSNRARHGDVFYREVDDDALPIQLTTLEGQKGPLSAAVFAGRPFAVFAHEGRSILAIDPDARSLARVVDDGALVHKLSARRLADGGDRAGVVAWQGEYMGTRGAFLRFVDERGQGLGEVLTVSEQTREGSQLSLAPQSGGGAVAYTVARDPSVFEIRFRAIAQDGTLGPERRITGANQRVRDVSIAAYAAGYVIAYRRIGEAAGAEATMQLTFVDEEGNVAGSRLVSAATSAGQRSQVLVGNDGRIVLLWGDARSDRTSPGEALLTVRAARLTCL